jgi:anti-sigma factor RsiW
LLEHRRADIMSFSDETLMAYADGELDLATRRAVEQACSTDLALARRVAYYKTRRNNAFAGFATGDDRERMRPPRPATIVSLDAVRARREAVQLAARKATRERRWSWPEWTALGGVLVVGVLAGTFGFSYFQAEEATVDLVASEGGTLVAKGRLVTALEQQPSAPPGAAGAATNAAARAAGAVRIGMSFVAVDGSYCRSFASGTGTFEIDGVACKVGQEWRLPLVMQNPRPAQAGKPAAAAGAPAGDIAPPVESAIEQRISGDPLDARAEQEAMKRGWQR